MANEAAAKPTAEDLDAAHQLIDAAAAAMQCVLPRMDQRAVAFFADENEAGTLGLRVVVDVTDARIEFQLKHPDLPGWQTFSQLVAERNGMQ